MEKKITYDRHTRDYAMYLNGELVGYVATYYAAEQALNELVYEMLRHRPADAEIAA